MSSFVYYNAVENKMKVEFKENFTPTLVNSANVELIGILKSKGLTISIAESFTGGNISAKLTAVSGASSVFYEGIVAYNEKAKINRLGVKCDTVKSYHPVSYEVALEMAQGLLNSKNCQVSISTTGIAGPNSDESGFPVGLCYVGIGYNDCVTVYKLNLDGSRQEIVEKGTEIAINLAINTIKNM